MMPSINKMTETISKAPIDPSEFSSRFIKPRLVVCRFCELSTSGTRFLHIYNNYFRVTRVTNKLILIRVVPQLRLSNCPR